MIGAVVILSACGNRAQNDISDVSDLPEILAQISQLDQDYAAQKISLEDYNSQSQALKEKYNELLWISTGDVEIPQETGTIQETIWLPDWAKSLGLTEPMGLNVNMAEYKQTTMQNEGYDSVILVYDGDYETSLLQAQQIATLANIPVSPEFKAAQGSLNTMTDEEKIQMNISGDMLKWIVYANYSLLDTKIDYLITISVDETGRLTIEAINYKQMKARK